MDLFSVITIIGRTISIPFLVLTFLHYWFTNKYRYLYRMCFMNYLVHLVISNIWSIWAVSNEYQKRRPRHILHIYNFIELSLLLWTNVLCFNFWQSIRNLMPFSDNKKEKMNYIKCLIYVWSFDLSYTTVGIINDYLLQDSYKQIYKNVRWFMILFQVILLLINSSMIVHSTIIIIHEIKAIKSLKGPNSIKNKKKHKKKLILYGKFFVITIFLLCSKWLWSSIDNMLKDPKIHEIFNYFMVGNAFQGLFIFFLFTLKKKKIKTIKSKVSELFVEQNTTNDPNTLESSTNKEMISFDTKELNSNNDGR